MNILEFLHFLIKDHIIESVIDLPQYKNLSGIRLLLQSHQSIPCLHFLNEFKEDFFEEEKLEKEKNRDTANRRKYIINLLKTHTPQLVIGEILADIIETFPQEIWPASTKDSDMNDLDRIDIFSELVSTISSEHKKIICDKLNLIEKRYEGKIDIYLSLITSLKKGLLYSLNVEKKQKENKHHLSIEDQYKNFISEYEKLENPLKIEEFTTQQITADEIATNIIRIKAEKIANNIICKNIEDFITILKKYCLDDSRLITLEKELNAREEKATELEPTNNTFFIEATLLLNKVHEFLKNDKLPEEVVNLLKMAIKLTDIQASTYILQKTKKLPSEEFFRKIPTLIKTIKKELTTKSQHESFKKNIKSYLKTCEVIEDNIPTAFSINNPKIQMLEKAYKETYKKILIKKTTLLKTIPRPPILLSELNKGKLPRTVNNQLVGNETYTVCINPSLIIRQINGVEIKFAQNNRTNQFFIVKSMTVPDDNNPNYQKLKNENDILNQLGKTHEILFEQKNPDGQMVVSVISPYVPGYDLRELLGHENSHGRFIPPKYLTDKERIIIARNILNKYLWLLENKLLHRDISHSNIRVNPETYEVECIDFADALKIDENNETKADDICGQAEMLAPELKNPPYIHSEKTDVYALGILLGDLLFNQEYGNALERKTSLQENQTLCELINTMKEIDISKRPTISNVKNTLNHLFPIQKTPHQKSSRFLSHPSTFGLKGGLLGFLVVGGIGAAIGIVTFGIGLIPLLIGVASAALGAALGGSIQVCLSTSKCNKLKVLPILTPTDSLPIVSSAKIKSKKTSIAKSMSNLISCNPTHTKEKELSQNAFEHKPLLAKPHRIVPKTFTSHSINYKVGP